MISEQEARDLVLKLKELKKENSPESRSKLREHENLCVAKLKYLVSMKLGKYKTFNNYEDLFQEGYEALLKAINTYDPSKGSIFWWCHKYIDTRISRSANLHTTIRYPLKIAKQQAPHKEAIMPNLIEKNGCPENKLHNLEVTNLINKNLLSLSERQRTILSMAFGLDDDPPCSTNKIAKKTNLSRSTVLREMRLAFAHLRENIKQ